MVLQPLSFLLRFRFCFCSSTAIAAVTTTAAATPAAAAATTATAATAAATTPPVAAACDAAIPAAAAAEVLQDKSYEGARFVGPAAALRRPSPLVGSPGGQKSCRRA